MPRSSAVTFPELPESVRIASAVPESIAAGAVRRKAGFSPIQGMMLVNQPWLSATKRYVTGMTTSVRTVDVNMPPTMQDP